LESLEPANPVTDLPLPVLNKNIAPESDTPCAMHSSLAESPGVERCSNAMNQDTNDIKVHKPMKSEATHADQLNSEHYVASLHGDFTDVAAASKDVMASDSLHGDDQTEANEMHVTSFDIKRANEYGNDMDDAASLERQLDASSEKTTINDDCCSKESEEVIASTIIENKIEVYAADDADDVDLSARRDVNQDFVVTYPDISSNLLMVDLRKLADVSFNETTECLVTADQRTEEINFSADADAKSSASLLDSNIKTDKNVFNSTDKKMKPNNRTVASSGDCTYGGAEPQQTAVATGAPEQPSCAIIANGGDDLPYSCEILGIRSEVSLRPTSTADIESAATTNERVTKELHLHNENNSGHPLSSERSKSHSSVQDLSQSAVAADIADVSCHLQHNQDPEDEVQHEVNDNPSAIQVAPVLKADCKNECDSFRKRQSEANGGGIELLKLTNEDTTHEVKSSCATLETNDIVCDNNTTTERPSSSENTKTHSSVPAISQSIAASDNELPVDAHDQLQPKQQREDKVQYGANDNLPAILVVPGVKIEHKIDVSNRNFSQFQKVVSGGGAFNSSTAQNEDTNQLPSSCETHQVSSEVSLGPATIDIENAATINECNLNVFQSTGSNSKCSLSSESIETHSNVLAISYNVAAIDKEKSADVADNEMQHNADENLPAIDAVLEAKAGDKDEDSGIFRQCQSAANKDDVSLFDTTTNNVTKEMTSSRGTLEISSKFRSSPVFVIENEATSGKNYADGDATMDQRPSSNERVEHHSNLLTTFHSAAESGIQNTADVKKELHHATEREVELHHGIDGNLPEPALPVESKARAVAQNEVASDLMFSCETNEPRSSEVNGNANLQTDDAATHESRGGFNNNGIDHLGPSSNESIDAHSNVPDVSHSAAASAVESPQDIVDQVQHGQNQDGAAQHNDNCEEKKVLSIQTEAAIGLNNHNLPHAHANDSSQEVFPADEAFKASGGGASSDIMNDFYEDIENNAPSGDHEKGDALTPSEEAGNSRLVNTPQIDVPNQVFMTPPESQQTYSSLVLKKFKIPSGRDSTPDKYTSNPGTVMESSPSSAGETTVVAQPFVGTSSPSRSEALKYNFDAMSAGNPTTIIDSNVNTTENIDFVAHTNSISLRQNFDEELARERVKVADAIMYRAEEVIKKERLAMMRDFQKEKDELLREVSEGYQEQWSEMQRDISTKKETEIATKVTELRDDWKRRNRTTSNLQEDIAGNSEAQALLVALKEQWASECDEHLKARDMEVKTLFKNELCIYRDEIKKEIEAERDEYVERAVMNARVEWDREQLNLKDNKVNKQRTN
jgi:hypothetical protein